VKFKALVRWGTGTQIVDAKLRELQPTQVLVRTLACCGCYTIVPTILGTNNVANPLVPNHSTMGIAEAVGPQVRRVRVGDRVLVSGTPECGHCYHCLNGEPSRCNYLGNNNNTPYADTIGGASPTPILQQSGVGGVAEYSVAWEEYCIPIFSDIPKDQVAMLGDTFAAGYLATKDYRPLTGGEDVVIFGAGAVGLGASRAPERAVRGRTSSSNRCRTGRTRRGSWGLLPCSTPTTSRSWATTTSWSRPSGACATGRPIGSKPPAAARSPTTRVVTSSSTPAASSSVLPRS
jgi:Zn-dependent alcohol dehydrogenase